MRKKIKCLSSIFLALVLMIATATIASAVESRYSEPILFLLDYPSMILPLIVKLK